MDKEQNFNVLIITPDKVIYEGEARSVVLPGESGVFEILPYHKGILSRLLRGKLIMDGRVFPIKRGVAKAGHNQLTVIVEEDR